jgi:hypothetical protein
VPFVGVNAGSSGFHARLIHELTSYAVLYYSNDILSKSLPELGPYVSLGITIVNVAMTFPPIFLIEVRHFLFPFHRWLTSAVIASGPQSPSSYIHLGSGRFTSSRRIRLRYRGGSTF